MTTMLTATPVPRPDGLDAHDRELVDRERHRIARELHDSVTQCVLAAGLAVEVARGEAEAHGVPEVPERLLLAKRLTQEAVEQLRQAIYALHQPPRERVPTLTERVREVVAAHRARPGAVDVVVETDGEGGASPLPACAERELVGAVGQALCNVATHAHATRAVVRLRYRADHLLVTVADDGDGDPVRLARRLRRARGPVADGRHRGLVNMECRLTGLGGTLAFRRAREGGVRVEMRVPLAPVGAG